MDGTIFTHAAHMIPEQNLQSFCACPQIVAITTIRVQITNHIYNPPLYTSAAHKNIICLVLWLLPTPFFLHLPSSSLSFCYIDFNFQVSLFLFSLHYFFHSALSFQQLTAVGVLLMLQQPLMNKRFVGQEFRHREFFIVQCSPFKSCFPICG